MYVQRAKGESDEAFINKGLLLCSGGPIKKEGQSGSTLRLDSHIARRHVLLPSFLSLLLHYAPAIHLDLIFRTSIHPPGPLAAYYERTVYCSIYNLSG